MKIEVERERIALERERMQAETNLQKKISGGTKHGKRKIARRT